MVRLFHFDALGIDSVCPSLPADDSGPVPGADRDSMCILILTAMVPLLGFYLYVLMNSQTELLRTKRNQTRGRKAVPLRRRAGQWGEAASKAETAAALQSYQFESVYLGPFLSSLRLGSQAQGRTEKRDADYSQTCRMSRKSFGDCL